MPELPEVETIKNDLSPEITGKKIKRIQIRKGRIFRKVLNLKQFQKDLFGRKILRVERKGKVLLFILDNHKIMVIRLGMTGQLILHTNFSGVLDPHVHLLMTLDNDSKIVYRDIRKFGQIFLVSQDKFDNYLKLGPDPLSENFSMPYLKQILNSPMKIKKLLLDQQKISGIGNIYADEILFTAKINPFRIACSLSNFEVKRLYHAIQRVLKEGIRKRGSTIRNFKDSLGKPGSYQNYLKVYQRDGKECLICKTSIKKMTINGRSCHFCPSCQQ